jgi:hypothetical protein
MSYDYADDSFDNVPETVPSGHLSIRGEICGDREWRGACEGSVSFCTNGPQGGDAGHGGYLRVTFTNAASTFMQVAVDGEEPKAASSITLTFRGDAEVEAAIQCLEFLADKLGTTRKLFN